VLAFGSVFLLDGVGCLPWSDMPEDGFIFPLWLPVLPLLGPDAPSVCVIAPVGLVPPPPDWACTAVAATSVTAAKARVVKRVLNLRMKLFSVRVGDFESAACSTVDPIPAMPVPMALRHGECRFANHLFNETNESRTMSQATPNDAVQAGPRDHPVELPAQHLEGSGQEAALELQPQFDAPDYRGSDKLKGAAALITGGDSGIGRAVAVLYAREGADVAIVYRSSHDDAQETLRCIEREGARGLAIAGDVRDAAFCSEAVARTVGEFGRLDVLVNNAAFQRHADSIDDITEARFDETMHTNIYGYFHMSRAALKHLGRRGSIINTGSVTGLEGSAKLLDYSATKGAIHAFTKALAQNVLARGIRVNAVAPGPVWTPLNPADVGPEQVSEFGRKSDMKRAAQPEEIAPAYVFLAAPVCASYITGIVLPITGSVGAE
jgi:NAD(P)-dependent dehydrogenase (short-subunit alcohol dehydrogenase family)